MLFLFLYSIYTATDIFFAISWLSELTSAKVKYGIFLPSVETLSVYNL